MANNVTNAAYKAKADVAVAGLNGTEYPPFGGGVGPITSTDAWFDSAVALLESVILT